MNKQILSLAIALLISVSGAAMAKCNCSDCGGKDMMAKAGGFVGEPVQISTVKEALSMKDDALVSLKGNIEKQIKKDKYMFKDSTGSMVVEIDKKVWRGQTVSAADTVVITGEIDKDFDKPKLEVDTLVKTDK